MLLYKISLLLITVSPYSLSFLIGSSCHIFTCRSSVPLCFTPSHPIVVALFPRFLLFVSLLSIPTCLLPLSFHIFLTAYAEPLKDRDDYQFYSRRLRSIRWDVSCNSGVDGIVRYGWRNFGKRQRPPRTTVRRCPGAACRMWLHYQLALTVG